MTLFNVEARVSRGATLLDLYRPSWFQAVDLDRLDVFSTQWCLLAQAYPSFQDGYSALWDHLTHSFDLEDYGFASACDRMTLMGTILSLFEHRQLKRAWSREVLKRREQAAIRRYLRRCADLGSLIGHYTSGTASEHSPLGRTAQQRLLQSIVDEISLKHRSTPQRLDPHRRSAQTCPPRPTAKSLIYVDCI